MELREEQVLKFDIVELDDSLFNFLINDDDPKSLNLSDVEVLEECSDTDTDVLLIEDSDVEENIEKKNTISQVQQCDTDSISDISDIHSEILEIEDSDVEQEAVKLENKHSIKQETGGEFCISFNKRSHVYVISWFAIRNCRQGVSGFHWLVSKSVARNICSEIAFG